MASGRKRTITTERPPLVSEVSANSFVDTECHVVSGTNPYGCILGFLEQCYIYGMKIKMRIYYSGFFTYCR
jgi:hypothetical protein